MRVTLLGKKTVDYDNKQGKHVEGVELHYAYTPNPNETDFEGRGVNKLFTRADCSKMVPGHDYDFIFELDPRWNRAEFVDWADVVQ